MISRKKLLAYLGTPVALLSVGGMLAFNNPNEQYFEIAKNLDIFATLFKEINTYYVDDVNPSKAIKTGIDAMLGSLDPYTNYIPEDEIEDFIHPKITKKHTFFQKVSWRHEEKIFEDSSEKWHALSIDDKKV